MLQFYMKCRYGRAIATSNRKAGLVCSRHLNLLPASFLHSHSCNMANRKACQLVTFALCIKHEITRQKERLLQRHFCTAFCWFPALGKWERKHLVGIGKVFGSLLSTLTRQKFRDPNWLCVFIIFTVSFYSKEVQIHWKSLVLEKAVHNLDLQ